MGRSSKLGSQVMVGGNPMDVDEFIVRTIRSGTFDYVAAEAAGVGSSTFYRWMEKGEKAQAKLDTAPCVCGHKLSEHGDIDPEPCEAVLPAPTDVKVGDVSRETTCACEAFDAEPLSAGEERYREFREKVLVARAQARMVAENQVRTANPLAWLRYGPGRDKPGRPGWTDSAEVRGEVTLSGTISIDDARQKLRREVDKLRQGVEGPAEDARD